jgi:hypothetical protein
MKPIFLSDQCHVDCEGFSRRDFVKAGALTVMGLTLPDFLRMKSAHAQDTPGARRRTPDASCIFLWMAGGPSHIDIFDPKPDAPSEVAGPFKTVKTNVPGIELSENMVLTAKHADKFALLRSVTHPRGDHEGGHHYMQTGYAPLPALEYPSYGAVVAKEKGFQKNLPPFVAIPQPAQHGSSGALGGVYSPFSVGGDPSQRGFSVRDVALPSGMNLSRIERRRTMLEKVDTFHRDIDAAGQIQSMDSFYGLAYNLLTSPDAKKAFDLSKEPDTVREKYGMNPLGQGCLLARRLVESGVRFVTVVRGGWDTHQNNFTSLKGTRLPELDKAIAALLDDLHQTGLLDNTLVVWMGEFGRTPRINSAAGRDHWPYAQTVLLAGGNIRGGQVVGSTNERGENPSDRPLKPEDVAATIYHCLGIDYTREYQTMTGRPIRIVTGGEAIREIV